MYTENYYSSHIRFHFAFIHLVSYMLIINYCILQYMQIASSEKVSFSSIDDSCEVGKELSCGKRREGFDQMRGEWSELGAD